MFLPAAIQLSREYGHVRSYMAMIGDLTETPVQFVGANPARCPESLAQSDMHRLWTLAMTPDTMEKVNKPRCIKIDKVATASHGAGLNLE